MLCAAQKSDQTEECVGVAVRVLERTQHVVREASGPHDASPTETRVGGASVQVAVDALPRRGTRRTRCSRRRGSCSSACSREPVEARGDHVVVEVLVAACSPAVEWREKNRSGGGRVILETAETAETDLRDSGKDQAGGGHGVLMQARARRAERTISRASISPCHRGQPRAADRGQPTVTMALLPSPAAALGVGETDAGPRRRCALPSGGAWAAPRELVG